MNTTAPGFWQGLAETRAAQLGPQPDKPPRSSHAHHLRLSLDQAIAVCRPCAATRAESMFRSSLLDGSAAARVIARWNNNHPGERFDGFDAQVAAHGYSPAGY